MSYVYKIVRIVMHLSKQTAVYDAVKGVNCPICERFRPEQSRGKVLTTIGRERFCVCNNPDCGHFFKAYGDPAKPLHKVEPEKPAVEPEKAAPEIEKPVVSRKKKPKPSKRKKK